MLARKRNEFNMANLEKSLRMIIQGICRRSYQGIDSLAILSSEYFECNDYTSRLKLKTFLAHSGLNITIKSVGNNDESAGDAFTVDTDIAALSSPWEMHFNVPKTEVARIFDDKFSKLNNKADFSEFRYCLVAEETKKYEMLQSLLERFTIALRMDPQDNGSSFYLHHMVSPVKIEISVLDDFLRELDIVQALIPESEKSSPGIKFYATDDQVIELCDRLLSQKQDVLYEYTQKAGCEPYGYS